MKILLLATKYTHLDDSPWLVSELVEIFAKQGVCVTVLHLDWSGSLSRFFSNKVANISLSRYISLNWRAGPFSLLFKWALSSIKLIIPLLRMKLRRQRYDLFIAFSPCTATYAAHPFAHSLSDRSFLIYWDFFPVHNQQILNKIPSFLAPLLKGLENRLISRFDKIGLMSPANVKYMKSYFRDISDDQMKIIPPWTSYLTSPSVRDYDIRKLCGIGSNRVIAVFGGQLVAGRGVTEICDAIVKANSINPELCLCVFGDGAFASIVNSYALRYPDVVYYMGSVPRDHYMQALANSDIGIVATVRGVSSPAYPSKSLDYMVARLPILAAVEDASDFGGIVEINRFGLSCPAGDQKLLVDALVELSYSPDTRRMLGDNGFSYLTSHHGVDVVAKNILDSL